VAGQHRWSDKDGGRRGVARKDRCLDATYQDLDGRRERPARQDRDATRGGERGRRESGDLELIGAGELRLGSRSRAAGAAGTAGA